MREETVFDRWMVTLLSVCVLAAGGCAALPPASAVSSTPVALKKLSVRELMDVEVNSVSRKTIADLDFYWLAVNRPITQS